MSDDVDMTVRVSGGFGRSYDRMSPVIRAQVMDADRNYERRALDAERERARRGAVFAERSMRASVEAALDRGEPVDLQRAWRDGGVGRTHAEVLADASARMDLDDRREAARRRREGAHVTDLDWSDMHSADTSAPDIHSDEGKAEQARIARQVAGGRKIQRDRRRTREQIEAEVSDLRSAVETLAQTVVARSPGRRFGR